MAMSTTRWLLCFAALGLAAITWRMTLARPPAEDDPKVGTAPPARAPEPEPRAPRTAERTEALPDAPSVPEPEPSAVSPEDASPEAERSALARELERMSATFLTTRPAVAELLERVGALAADAILDPASVSVAHDPEGALLSARGEWTVGDVRGAFRVDADGYDVRLSTPCDEPPWARAEVHFSFQVEDGRVRACHAIVQFQPRVEGGGEGLAGWTVSVEPTTGATAQPITSLDDTGWLPAQEFPWLTDASGFDAWLQWVAPHAAR
jgi:hypothetical protein